MPAVDPDQRYVLAVDLGTGGPKVGLVSLAGALVWSEHQPTSTRHAEGGSATQDADEWWRLISSASRRAVRSGVVPVERIVAVSCTGQWASTVPVDADGLPVGDCLMWLDTRGADMVRSAVGGPIGGYAPIALARWILHSGGAPSTSGADPIGHILFIEHSQPDVARSARWYLEPVDYLSMRFTGIAAASPASMAGAWLTDNRHPERLRYDPVLVQASGVPGWKLPPLVPTLSVLGKVQPAVVQDLGLEPGVVVVAGTPDLHSAAAGSGAVLAHQPHLAISTTSWVSCPYPKKKTDPIRQMATVPGVLPGLNLVANNQEAGGGALEWLRDCLSAADGPSSFEQLTALAAQAEPGSGGVIFTPWLAGERSPIDDRSARGGFHNLSLRTSRAEMVRAVMEGVAFNSRWLSEAVERFTGQRFGSIRAVGGGATSGLWCSIYADILDRVVEQVDEPVHANLRGSALLAGLGLGLLKPDELRSLVPLAATHRPEPSSRRRYDHLFSAFPALYSAQKGMFKRLNRRS
ncbi:MAG: FGGY-family carbohydrate kinase [Acidimicrobiales bacterium]|jgi:xylulokinase